MQVGEGAREPSTSAKISPRRQLDKVQSGGSTEPNRGELNGLTGDGNLGSRPWRQAEACSVATGGSLQRDEAAGGLVEPAVRRRPLETMRQSGEAIPRRWKSVTAEATVAEGYGGQVRVHAWVTSGPSWTTEAGDKVYPADAGGSTTAKVVTCCSGRRRVQRGTAAQSTGE